MSTECFLADIAEEIRHDAGPPGLSCGRKATVYRRLGKFTGRSIGSPGNDHSGRVCARRPPDLSGRLGLMPTAPGSTGRPTGVPSDTEGADRFPTWTLHRVGDTEAGRDGPLPIGEPSRGPGAATVDADRAVLAGSGTAELLVPAPFPFCGVLEAAVAAVLDEPAGHTPRAAARRQLGPAPSGLQLRRRHASPRASTRRPPGAAPSVDERRPGRRRMAAPRAGRTVPSGAEYVAREVGCIERSAFHRIRDARRARLVRRE